MIREKLEDGGEDSLRERNVGLEGAIEVAMLNKMIKLKQECGDEGSL